MKDPDNGRRRSSSERRQSVFPINFMNRRFGEDRRNGSDRRSGVDRRSPKGFRRLIGSDRRKGWRSIILVDDSVLTHLTH